jgi:AcrR family transcriptional regulator
MSGLRERKKEQTRAAILSHAEALFRERGFEDTRVRDIVERVEISEPTFFKYFPSKQALVDEFAFAWLRDAAATWPNAAVDTGTEGASQRLTNLGKSFQPLIRAIEADRPFMLLVLTHASLWNPQGVLRGKHAEVGHPLHESTRSAFAAIASFFEQAQRRGEIRPELDPMQLGEISFAVFRTTLQLWASDYWHDNHDLEERLNRAFDVLFSGMRTKS